MENTTPETKEGGDYKNFVIALLALVILVVFVPKGLGFVKQYQTDTQNLKSENSLSKIDQDLAKPACLENQTPLKTVDTSNWVKSVGTYDLHFETYHPANVIISRSNDKLTNYTILNQSTGLSARVEVTKLEESLLKIGSKSGPVITYEQNTNTFWSQSNQNEPAAECEPTPNYTKSGYLVLKTVWGDVGEYRIEYHLILKPSAEKYKEYDGNRPIGISISYGWSVNEEGFYSEENEGFITMLEGMIQEMTLKPVHKG